MSDRTEAVQRVKKVLTALFKHDVNLKIEVLEEAMARETILMNTEEEFQEFNLQMEEVMTEIYGPMPEINDKFISGEIFRL